MFIYNCRIHLQSPCEHVESSMACNALGLNGLRQTPGLARGMLPQVPVYARPKRNGGVAQANKTLLRAKSPKGDDAELRD